MASPEIAGCSARAKAQSIHRARCRPAVSVLVLRLVSVFGEQWFLAAQSDWFAEFPEAPLDSESAFGFRESDPVLVVSKDRQGQASVAVFAAGLERVQCLRQRTQWMPEPPA